MKKFKKVFAVILSLAMVLGMSVTSFADDQQADRIPRPADTVDVTIENIGGAATVTLYKIAEAEYQTNGLGILGYNAITGVDLSKLVGEPSSATITTIANQLVKGGLTPLGETIVKKEVTGTFTANVGAGAYIAIISEATDGKVYNPILLTAAYAPTADADEGILANQLVGGSVSTGDHYLSGATAVAKSTTPDVDKEIVSGTTNDLADSSKKTASIGDVITYQITPTMPQYPKEAINKTFFVADTMDEGLTFDYSTLTISIEGVTATKAGNTFKIGDVPIANAAETDNGFNLAFLYNGLISNAATGAVYTPVVSYSAVVNEKATIGEIGNDNDARMYFANQPNSGSSYENPNEEPDADEDKTITKKEDKKTVYTYRLAFLKNDEKNPKKVLAGAVFGIYDADNNLVDEVTTNEKGYAETTNVKSGVYTVKELVAPEGYALSNETYTITADWATATTTVTGTVTNCKYTSDITKSLDQVQVGWLKDGQFYAMDEFTEEVEDVVFKAYVEKAATTTTTMTEVVENPTLAVGGVSLMTGAIPNTTLASLPSTGGIGTTIFTIGGCAIMIIAAALFFASRRKSAK